MRYTPAALALSLLGLITASVATSAPPRPVDGRAAALVEQGRKALAGDQVDTAIDLFETALVIQPGSPAILLSLAEATRKQGMHGKAIHYYRQALADDPNNLLAIAGEGAAMAEKGAMDKAKRNLARLQGLCGKDCDAARQLETAIAKGPAPKVVAAKELQPEPMVSEN